MTDQAAADATRAKGKVTGGHVLAIMLVFFGVIIAVNATFVTMAARTFPGLVVEEPFKRGLAKDFNRTLEDRTAQAARGWSASVAQQWDAETGRVALTVEVRDAAGTPATGLALTGLLQRVVTDADDRAVAFTPLGEGVYRGESAAAPGNWRLALQAQFPDGAPFEAEKRLWLAP